MNITNDQDFKIVDSEVERKSAGFGVTMGVATDTTLQIGDRQFQAHRSVLSLYSPVIKALISESWSETDGETFQISDEHIDVDVMNDLLAFLYTGRITLTADNAHPVCVTANFLGISTLLNHTVKYLCQQLTIENVLPLIEFSSTVQLEALFNFCFLFINANYAEAFQDSRFLELPSKDFKDLIVGLKERVWGTNLRKDTFRLIIRWTEKNITERSNDLPVLLKNIPLEELPLDFLTGTVSTHPLVQDSPSCLETLSAGIKNYRAYSETASKTQQNFIVFGTKSEKKGPRRIIGCYDWQTHIFTKLPTMYLRRIIRLRRPTRLRRIARLCGITRRYDFQTYFLPPMIEPTRTHFACTAIDGKRFVVAGGRIDKRSTDVVSMFNWNTRTWSKLPEMPCPRWACSMMFFNGFLYVTGGRIDSGIYSSHSTRTVERYSFATQQWTSLNEMIYERDDGQLIEHKGFLYAIGGWGESGYQNSIERYDPVNDEWTEMASMHNDPQRLVAAVHQGSIYVLSNSSLQVYDPETNVWTNLGEPNIGDSAILLSMNGHLVAVGAVARDIPDGRKHVWRLDTSTHLWTPLFDVTQDMIHTLKLPWRWLVLSIESQQAFVLLYCFIRFLA